MENVRKLRGELAALEQNAPNLVDPDASMAAKSRELLLALADVLLKPQGLVEHINVALAEHPIAERPQDPPPPQPVEAAKAPEGAQSAAPAPSEDAKPAQPAAPAAPAAEAPK